MTMNTTNGENLFPDKSVQIVTDTDSMSNRLAE